MTLQQGMQKKSVGGEEGEVKAGMTGMLRPSEELGNPCSPSEGLVLPPWDLYSE